MRRSKREDILMKDIMNALDNRLRMLIQLGLLCGMYPGECAGLVDRLNESKTNFSFFYEKPGIPDSQAFRSIPRSAPE